MNSHKLKDRGFGPTAQVCVLSITCPVYKRVCSRRTLAAF